MPYANNNNPPFWSNDWKLDAGSETKNNLLIGFKLLALTLCAGGGVFIAGMMGVPLTTGILAGTLIGGLVGWSLGSFVQASASRLLLQNDHANPHETDLKGARAWSQKLFTAFRHWIPAPVRSLG